MPISDHELLTNVGVHRVLRRDSVKAKEVAYPFINMKPSDQVFRPTPAGARFIVCM